MPDWVDAIQIEGRNRNFTCHVPPGAYTESRPLLITLHGRNLTVEEFRRITHFDAVADRHDCVLVYPEGYRRSWNDGRGNTPVEQEGVDDVAFIRTLVGHLSETVGIDPARVGVTGLSNGGVMCHRLGLELSDRAICRQPFASSRRASSPQFHGGSPMTIFNRTVGS